MGVLYDSLIALAPVHDAEMDDGYARYEALLETILTPRQMEDYAAYIRETNKIRIFEEMTPDELAGLPPPVSVIAAAVLADINISMENRRVAALLNQRGEHAVAPDLGGEQLVNRPPVLINSDSQVSDVDSGRADGADVEHHRDAH
jgi:hypothetical protein